MLEQTMVKWFVKSFATSVVSVKGGLATKSTILVVVHTNLQPVTLLCLFNIFRILLALSTYTQSLGYSETSEIRKYVCWSENKK